MTPVIRCPLCANIPRLPTAVWVGGARGRRVTGIGVLLSCGHGLMTDWSIVEAAVEGWH